MATDIYRCLMGSMNKRCHTLTQYPFLDLTRFRGYLITWQKGGCHDAEDTSAVSAGVQAAENLSKDCKNRISVDLASSKSGGC